VTPQGAQTRFALLNVRRRRHALTERLGQLALTRHQITGGLTQDDPDQPRSEKRVATRPRVPAPPPSTLLPTPPMPRTPIFPPPVNATGLESPFKRPSLSACSASCRGTKWLGTFTPGDRTPLPGAEWRLRPDGALATFRRGKVSLDAVPVRIRSRS
jgi:hypothetical protein